MRVEVGEIHCTICGGATRFQWSGLCDSCWEVRTRLENACNDKARLYFKELLEGILESRKKETP